MDVHFEVQETIGEEVYTEKYHIESAKDIHPDLRACFKELRPIMARIFNLTSFLTMIEADVYKSTHEQEESAREFAKQLLEKIEVRGVSLSGKDDNVGCVITGLFNVINNQKTCINSPRMKFANVVYGFEEELEEIISRMESEVYLFLFKGKKAELELFDAMGGPSESMAAMPAKPKGKGKGKKQGEIGKEIAMFPDMMDPAIDEEDEEEPEPVETEEY